MIEILVSYRARNRFYTSLDIVLNNAVQCSFCSRFLRIVGPVAWTLSPATILEFRSASSGIVLNVGRQVHRALSIGRLYPDPGPTEQVAYPAPSSLSPNSSVGSVGSRGDFQLRFPSLLGSQTPAHFELLRQWLRDCDEYHPSCRRRTTDGVLPLPMRLVEIGTTTRPRLRLVESIGLGTSSGKQKIRFAALSYPWGSEKTHRHYATTTENYSRHLLELSLEDLPLLFHHAVRVAREIDIAYLWIDSLCIVQGEDGDFAVEAERMENVFSAAYCVLAASRATGVSDGFLGECSQPASFALPDSGLVVAEDIDDFQRDVLDGHLNTRGWVLQERALARRTIFFTAVQTYWECSMGIRCETMTRMANKQASFLGDSNFPRVAERNTKGGRIRLFEQLFEQYSRLQFSKLRDRPIALAGLERRLRRAFSTAGAFGVFDRYLGRCLLWQRAQDVISLDRITDPKLRVSVPSWSWMAYAGAIAFLDLPFAALDWATHELQTPWPDSPSFSPDLSSSSLRVLARACDLGSLADDPLSHLIWDLGPPTQESCKCLVVARLIAEKGSESQRHYVLILKPTLGSEGKYERVAVGWLQRGRIADVDGKGEEVELV